MLSKCFISIVVYDETGSSNPLLQERMWHFALPENAWLEVVDVLGTCNTQSLSELAESASFSLATYREVCQKASSMVASYQFRMFSDVLIIGWALEQRIQSLEASLSLTDSRVIIERLNAYLTLFEGRHFKVRGSNLERYTIDYFRAEAKQIIKRSI